MERASVTAAVRKHRCLCTKQILELAEGRLNPPEVQDLLTEVEQCPECLAVLGEAGLAVAHEAQDSDAGRDSGFFDSGALLGSIVAGRYRVDRWLGKGGMGEVYEARDLELDERVALKTIIPGFAQEHTALRRFKREVRLARQIVHPNVCRVLEFGRDSQGDAARYFLTMELLEGETLREKLRKEGALAPETALQIVIQICSGLGAIHRAGVLHRDVKPGNIMLRPAPQQERPGDRFVASLLDFGIARTFTGSVTKEGGARVDSLEVPHPGSAQTLTTHAAVGTPDYMAPEQISGGPLSAASDLYSLGVVLSEMLTGKKPNRSRPSSIASERLSPALEDVANWCLDPEPSKRPKSAEELREVLTRLSRRDDVDSRTEHTPLAFIGPADIGATTPRSNWPIRLATLREALQLPRVAPSLGTFLWGAVLGGGTLVILATSFPRDTEPTDPSPPPAGLASRREPQSVAATDPISLAVEDDAAKLKVTTDSQPLELDGSPLDTPLPPQRKHFPAVDRAAKGGTSPTELSGTRASLEVAKTCSPPYFYDSEGIKTFRKECL